MRLHCRGQGSRWLTFVVSMRWALRLPNRAFSLNQNVAAVVVNRGNINSFVGEQEKAIEHFTHGLRLSPLDPEIFRVEGALAIALLLLGRYQEAIDWSTSSLARSRTGHVPCGRQLRPMHLLAISTKRERPWAGYANSIRHCAYPGFHKCSPIIGRRIWWTKASASRGFPNEHYRRVTPILAQIV